MSRRRRETPEERDERVRAEDERLWKLDAEERRLASRSLAEECDEAETMADIVALARNLVERLEELEEVIMDLRAQSLV